MKTKTAALIRGAIVAGLVLWTASSAASYSVHTVIDLKPAPGDEVEFRWEGHILRGVVKSVSAVSGFIDVVPAGRRYDVPIAPGDIVRIIKKAPTGD